MYYQSIAIIKDILIKYFFISVFLIPQRYILGIMGFLAVVNAYTMRVVLSVAITEMLQPIVHNETIASDSCLDDWHINSTSIHTVVSSPKSFIN